MSRKGSADMKSIPHTRINDETWIWEKYEPGEKIGQGTFGKVFKVKHKETGKDWAMKVINKEKVRRSNECRKNPWPKKYNKNCVEFRYLCGSNMF